MSDPNYLQVDFGAMEELCTTLGQLEQQAQTAMNDMTKVVDTNLAAWNGQARTMYEHSRANWDKVFASLTALVRPGVSVQ